MDVDMMDNELAANMIRNISYDLKSLLNLNACQIDDNNISPHYYHLLEETQLLTEFTYTTI